MFGLKGLALGTHFHCAADVGAVFLARLLNAKIWRACIGL